MTNDERETFKRALDRWGTEAQVNMLHEEIGELLVALNKLWRTNGAEERGTCRVHVVEEIEDVRIMLDQMLILIGVTEKEAENQRRAKVQRLRTRLGRPVLP